MSISRPNTFTASRTEVTDKKQPSEHASRTTGSFHPLHAGDQATPSVLFALILPTDDQRRALNDEIEARLSAVHKLSETLTTAKLESPESRTHGDILDAVAILSRDALGLLQAMRTSEAAA